MKYLLDTNVVVEYLRGKKSIEASLLQEGSVISVITKAELFYGAYKSERSESNLSKIKEMLGDLNIETVPLNDKILNRYGKLKAELEKKGLRLDEFDLLIAATAIGLNLVLATRNLKHFQRISQLKVRG